MKEYVLTRIDLLDTYIFADIFDGGNYQVISESDEIDDLIPVAIERFWAANPSFKDWERWVREAENGGYEIEIARNYSSIFRGSLLLLDLSVQRALELALKWHQGRKRKAGRDTDMTHLLQVANILRLTDRESPDKELIASAFCHDLLEDTECSEDEILTACGAEVLNIVKACSNDPALQENKDWELKKTNYIKSVEKGGRKAMLLSLADKIANARSLLEIHEDIGDEIWGSFNRGKEQKIWFERSVFKMLERHLKGHILLNEYSELIEKMKLL